ncbi:hypothetical protein FJ987_14925 [Mesorhizobium sp. CU2]|uniref:hypothetical protein n=1 Tax=unclassified Mesorhizobium TaxID=325217 RepID=UPI00112E4D63|nr:MULTISPECIES: hypothetical protein [unclassified Mesorhizobium]TPN85726.1 hypothetical protein FJ988_09240 [Mesorhizobium sp. CU3]TPO14200.1 hypothetical protein FJ987_14925 [Mesorhizobium sp. CU2]
MKPGVVLGLATVCLSSVASAAPPEELYPPAVARSIREGQTLEAFLQSVMSPFRIGADRQGTLTREMVDRVAKQGDAGNKVAILAQFIKLDLNQDGMISKAEIEELRAQPDGNVAVLLSKAMLSTDTDGDGNVSLLEAYRHAQPSQQSGRRGNLADYLALGDGSKVTASQVLDKAMAVFQQIDSDRNTVLSRDEIAKVGSRLPPELGRTVVSNAQSQISSCEVPRPSANAETVLLGTYEGDAMADVHVNNPDDETTTSSIVVQPGRTPLYIVVTSYEAQIWDVSGAVERVEKLIVAAPVGGVRSGVVGLSKDRVALATNGGPGCMTYFYKSGTGETANARRAFLGMVGSDADHVSGIYSLSRVSVPDMTFEDLAPTSESRKVPEQFDASSWRSGLRFTPRGLVRFDPASVVSSVPAKRYEVLPQEFGLSQLVHSGHMEQRGSGTFRIVRSIPQFPAGLAGAHSVQFSLAKGVPMPAGDPGHSCVVSEEKDEAVGPSARACLMMHPKLDPQGKFK